FKGDFWMPLVRDDGFTPLLPTAASIGEIAPFSLLGEKFFLWKGADGQLRLMLNQCTHLRNKLVKEPDVAESLICPLHDRVFDSTGTCTYHQLLGECSITDKCHLRQFPLAQWDKLPMFMSFGKPAPFHEVYSEILASVAGLPLSQLRYHSHGQEFRCLHGNWKRIAELFVDPGHVNSIHPKLQKLVMKDTYHKEVHKHSILQWAYAAKPEMGIPLDNLPESFRDPEHPERRPFALWWSVEPYNVCLGFSAWGVFIYLYLPVPGNPFLTNVYWLQYAMDEEKFVYRHKDWDHRGVNEEDMQAVPDLMAPVGSAFGLPGTYTPEDTCLHAFHRFIAQTVLQDLEYHRV
ncbi:MAG: Rieske 2Fe-2S domain-containing protein, partial [Candidatus Tectomicrobia bacterium]|nr:Rieske 2Fe-2S domain-containing protein [Candidatus Tectomicrobia bacterium]